MDKGAIHHATGSVIISRKLKRIENPVESRGEWRRVCGKCAASHEITGFNFPVIPIRLMKEMYA
jgi:hypothetical protein